LAGQQEIKQITFDCPYILLVPELSLYKGSARKVKVFQAGENGFFALNRTAAVQK
jgi:hypothetical protein